MNATAPFPWLCSCFIGACLTPLAAMSLEEAGLALGDETFSVREQAEQVIRMAGMADYDKVQQFSRSTDPEVATRARRSLPIILLDIDDQVPAELAAKLRRIDDFRGRDLVPLVSAVAELKPPRAMTLIGLDNYLLTSQPAGSEITGQLLDTTEKALTTPLRDAAVLTELRDLRPELYHVNTLATVLNNLCRHQQGDLTPLLPLHDAWAKAHPDLSSLLNADGYRLELCRVANKLTNRSDALRRFLELATKGQLSPLQADAVRRQIADYRDEAATFPVNTLDQATGWYFFNVLGIGEGGQCHLDAYREYRKRFPNISETSLLAQPLEVLLVLDKSGAPAAMDYALKQTVHGGVILLAEHLHAHPELIREPLPLPELKDNKQPYPYRPVKFLRVFAPYATDAEMRTHPEIADAFDILTKDPRWNDVAKQARTAIAEQKGHGEK